jgi:hypothetical protein
MNEYTTPEAELNFILERYSLGPYNEVENLLRQKISEYPLDDRLYYLRHALFSAQSKCAQALNDLWHCMELQPKQLLYLKAIDALLFDDVSDPCGTQNLEEKEPNSNDSSIPRIRPENLAKYKHAVKHILGGEASRTNQFGIDLSHDEGQGALLLHKITGSRLLGICGTEKAAMSANKICGNHRVAYLAKTRDFRIREQLFDFGTCFDILERSADPETVIEQLFSSVKGDILLSAHSEASLPYSKCRNYFGDHKRHFTLDDLSSLLGRQKTYKIEGIWGQLVYDPNDLSVILPVEKMYVRPHDIDSQIHLIHLRAT